ncbi:hemin uptake protein HemP [Rhodovibrio salinarum]|nr:hemin uptake protein HemP [Rhodovibrio salinarum]
MSDEPQRSSAGQDRHDGAQPAAVSTRRSSTLHSRDLLAGQHEVFIEHRGALYRLRETSQGKLILTK